MIETQTGPSPGNLSLIKKERIMKTRANQILVKCMMMAALWSTIRCAPVVCDMQSARLAGKHNVEVTPGYSVIQFAKEESNEKTTQASTGKLLGMQVAYGLTDKLDLRLRVEHFQFRDESATVFSIGPKFSLVKDRVAVYVPLWFLGYTPAQIQPTILFTIPVLHNKIDFNPSVKHIISLGGYSPQTGVMVALKAGLSISTDLSKWAIHPEYGIVYSLMDKKQYRNFSIGLSLNVSRLFKKLK